MGVEPLEPRALLANIAATGVISSTPYSGDYTYTIKLINSSSSDSGIGTFWYASSPGQDYLATPPISVTAPAGWTEQISNNGSGDGYGIQFVANSSSNDIQPGSSLSFTFISADPPSSTEGDSTNYPSVPTGTSIVYPGAPDSDAGHTLVVSLVALASIAVTPVNPNVPNGETDQLMAVGTFTDNSTQNLTSQVAWASNATSVATISNASGSQGLVTGVGQGTSSISATLSGITGSTALTVNPAALVSLALTPASPLAEVGTTDQFTATGKYSDNTTQNLTSTVNWASGTTSVASISNSSGSQGLATAVAKGSSTISAALNGIAASVPLSVTPMLESIAITPANPDVPKGETAQLTATGTFADNSTENLTQDVTWASANTTTATISNAVGSIGFAPALEIGTSSISATLEGVTGSTVLTVGPPALQSIWISPANPSILEGTSDQLTATGDYSDGSTRNLTNVVSWTSATASVATLTPAGLADGIAPGTSSVSATYQGLTGSIALVVDPPPVTLTNVAPITKRNKVTELVLTFSSSLSPNLALQSGMYRLVVAGNHGLFTAKNATVIKLRTANYFAASSPDTVTLIPRTPFTLRKPVKLTINGLPPAGLEDSEGRLIDGNQDGQPGGNAVALIEKNDVTIEA